MLFIILTVIQSTLLFVAFKIFKKIDIDNLQAITVNYIVAAIFGYIIFEDAVSYPVIISKAWLNMALLLGLLFIITFSLFALSSQKVGVALTSVASKMSVVMPVTFGVILYSDHLSVLKIVGILAALGAFYLTFKKEKKIRLEKKLIILPVLLFLGNGTIDTLLKYTEHHHIVDDLILFLTVIFLTGFLIGFSILIFRLILRLTVIKGRNIIGGILLGLLNFGSTYYMVKAMGVFDSSVLFPVANSGIVGLSALAGYFGFREKLSLINWIGIALSIIAILLISNA